MADQQDFNPPSVINGSDAHSKISIPPPPLPSDQNPSTKPPRTRQIADAALLSSSLPSKPSSRPPNSDTSSNNTNSTDTPSSSTGPCSESSTPQKQPKPDGLKRSDPFQFGTRYLEEGDDEFAFNAWDHVEVDDEYKAYAEGQYDMQRSNPFPILTTATSATSPPIRLLEVGCGAGNTLFPILSSNKNPNFHIHGADFSKTSIELIRSNELYTLHHPKHVSASVWDLGNADGVLPEGIEPESLDVVILIFVFSALHPDQWAHAVKNVNKCLKKGGKVLFRDYGRGDLAQVRFKKGRFLQENFYIRGDGTRVYFFDRDELGNIFDPKYKPQVEEDTEREDTGMKTVLLGVDRRMLVNRARKIKMHRCWLQGLFVKGGDEEVEKTLGEQKGPEPQWMRVAHTDVTDQSQEKEVEQVVDTPGLEEQVKNLDLGSTPSV
ncbi:hypothetical protein TWF788_007800 [Orbilia oligospora]|uniref:Methyltransferase type 12 domain-containing protein n=1 Tax=Orbilia oligospora TaxID=2813651 RepID=A0A7C8TW01_ORBOL|nr:hypothetical protein TWF788_007800 [Orbilia oligospora]KAF3206824.1 hypothetical protein TWF679_008606 [Orbilia oligospora]